jgi:hypothetical protein
MISGKIHDVKLVTPSCICRADQKCSGCRGGIASDLTAEDRTVLEGHGVDCQTYSGNLGEIAIEVECIGLSILICLVSIGGIEQEDTVFVIAVLLVSMKPLVLVYSWADARYSSNSIRITGFLI